MAEEPEVIQEQIEETRHSLADKLGALTEKVTGTVETVSETVEGVQEAVSQTVEAVAETVETVGETAQAAVENVKEAFNLPKQFEQHPWLFFGGSIALGFLGGKIILNMLPEADHGMPSSRAAEHMTEYMAQTSASTTARPADYTAQASRPWQEEAKALGRGTAEQPQEPSWFGNLIQNFMPDLNKIKELALGTLFATARDLVSRNVPATLKNEVQTLFNDMAEHAGAKPIQGQILEEGTHQPSGQTTGQHQTSEQKEVAV